MPACPLPAAPNFATDFAHPNDPIDFGLPISCVRHFPVIERGQRRNWKFVIAYAKREETHTFTLPCPSLPVELSRKEVISTVIKSRKQKLREDIVKELPAIRANYHEVLSNRKDDEHKTCVDKFLDSLPQNNNQVHESYFCALSLLSRLYGNEVYVPPEVYVRGRFNVFKHAILLTLLCVFCFNFVATGARAMRRPDYYVDPISWSRRDGCTMTKKQREEVGKSQSAFFLNLVLNVYRR